MVLILTKEELPLRLIYLSLLTTLYSQDTLDVDLDLDKLWEEAVWEEIEDVVGATEKLRTLGNRGAEAEDEALEHLYYRKSMKGIALIDLKKAYGKLYNKRNTITNPQELKKVDSYLNYLKKKIKKREA